jgi:hypothetical protein
VSDPKSVNWPTHGSSGDRIACNIVRDVMRPRAPRENARPGPQASGRWGALRRIALSWWWPAQAAGATRRIGGLPLDVRREDCGLSLLSCRRPCGSRPRPGSASQIPVEVLHRSHDAILEFLFGGDTDVAEDRTDDSVRDRAIKTNVAISSALIDNSIARRGALRA